MQGDFALSLGGLPVNKNEVLLDSYALQKDLRIKLPKQIKSNLPVDVGTVFVFISIRSPMKSFCSIAQQNANDRKTIRR